MTFKILFSFVMFLELRMICSVTYYQVGIYSNCTDRTNRTQLNINAGLVSDFNRDMIAGMKSRYGINDDLIYQVYDVCDNITLLAEIIQNLILD